MIFAANPPAPAEAGTNSLFRLGGDLSVNRLGFGAMRITGEGIWGWPPDRGNALKVLRRAVELGVDLIDTADAYGPETSELLIAEALHPYPKDLVIATKGGLTRPGPGRCGAQERPPGISHPVLENSLKRLPPSSKSICIDCIASIRRCRWKSRSEHSRRCRRLERFGT